MSNVTNHTHPNNDIRLFRITNSCLTEVSSDYRYNSLFSIFNYHCYARSDLHNYLSSTKMFLRFKVSLQEISRLKHICIKMISRLGCDIMYHENSGNMNYFNFKCNVKYFLTEGQCTVCKDITILQQSKLE